MNQHQEINRIDDISSANTDDMLPIEMTNTTGTSFLDLNEYCLIEIFSANSLTPMDLCSLAETCTLFKKITQQVKLINLGIESYACSHAYRWRDCSNFGRSVSEQDVERILKHFGSRLSTFSTQGNPVDVDLLTKYCGDTTLRRLEIFDVESIEGICVQLKSIIERLLALALRFCHLTDCTSSFQDISYDSLVELEIFETTGCHIILGKTFRNLKRFRFSDYAAWSQKNCDDKTDTIAKFIGRHARLTALKLSGGSVYCSSKLLDAIGSSCQELDVLSLRSLKTPAAPSVVYNRLSLPMLRTLEVFFHFENYNEKITLLQSSSALETVRLLSNEPEVPVQVFDVLSQLQNLRELQLGFQTFRRIPSTMLMQLRKLRLHEQVGKFCASDLFGIISQMPNLEEFFYYGNNVFALAEEDYAEIVKMVAQRPNVLILTCRCNFNVSNQFDAEAKVFLRALICSV